MPLSPSARSRKCQLMKKGFSEAAAIKYLYEHGFNKENADHNASAHDRADDDTTKPHTPDAPLVSSITEQVWEQCLIRLINESKTMTPQIIDKIRDYLDKKGAIQPKKQDVLPIIAEADKLEFSS